MTLLFFISGFVAAISLVTVILAAVYIRLKRKQGKGKPIQGYLDLIPDLSQEQRLQVQEIRRTFLPRVEGIREQLRLKRAELADLLFAAPAERPAIDRVAGENAAGGKSDFAGSLGTQVVKIFDIVAARTGVRESDAREAGFDPLNIDLEVWDHKAYYPGATPLRIRITGDRKTHRLLGAQMIGHYRAEVSKRIDIVATAIFNDMTVESLSQLDLSYTPPLSSPWDPVQTGSQVWIKELG